MSIHGIHKACLGLDAQDLFYLYGLFYDSYMHLIFMGSSCNVCMGQLVKTFMGQLCKKKANKVYKK